MVKLNKDDMIVIKISDLEDILKEILTGERFISESKKQSYKNQLDKIKMSPRLRNRLDDAGITTIDEMIRHRDVITKVRGIGVKLQNEFRNLLIDIK